MNAGDRLYGAIVALYPREFRRRHGADMRLLFRDLVLDPEVGRARLVMTVLGDLAAGLAQRFVDADAAFARAWPPALLLLLLAVVPVLASGARDALATLDPFHFVLDMLAAASALLALWMSAAALLLRRLRPRSALAPAVGLAHAATALAPVGDDRPTSTAALEAMHLSRTFVLGGQTVLALQQVSLRIERGEFVALIGPSGSGKSTLLGLISGLDRPTAGRVIVDGIDITAMREDDLASIRNRKIGVVFQAFNLIPTLTALENVEVPLMVGGHAARPREAATEMLALVGLEHRLHNRPAQLSGGEQQRVAIARALVTRPAVVIMDEPTGNLDRANSEAVLHLVAELRGRFHTTVVVATHEPLVAGAADRALALADGRLVG